MQGQPAPLLPPGVASPPAPSGPPRPRFVLSVGITGHRTNRLTPDLEAAARARTDRVLAAIATAAGQLAADGAAWFAPGAPELRLVSALAEGADRLCAEVALAQGYRLDAVLPFDRRVYADDFETEASLAHFDRLLGEASTRLELPGRRAEADAAYSLAGGAIVATADLLIAIWNGEGSGGRGGTGDVVATALAQGKPVVHIPLDPTGEVRLLWQGRGAASGAFHSALELPGEAADEDSLEAALGALLLPPEAPEERAALAAFFAETEQLRVRRIEYPLLLALTGVQPLRASAWRKAPYLAATRQDWARFDAARADRLDPDDYRLLEEAYAWADNLANRFAQFFRSGHVVNFTFSAIAVALALLGFLFGALKTLFVCLELVLIAAIVANTRVGRAESWHQRWLDYRQLAERLRPMRSLKLLAVARAPAPSAANRTAARRWLDWYAGAVWRQLALPDGRIDSAELDRLVALLKTEELGPEVDYHRRNAHRMAHVNHRLHRFGSVCFLSTVALCVAFLLSSAVIDPALAKQLAIFFTVATATLPAFGTAAYGLRVQGDFAGSAARSAATAEALAALIAELEPEPTLARTAAIGNAAASVMLVDLAEWRLTYQQRALEIPG
jgi:hypothetical protein